MDITVIFLEIILDIAATVVDMEDMEDMEGMAAMAAMVVMMVDMVVMGLMEEGLFLEVTEVTEVMVSEVTRTVI